MTCICHKSSHRYRMAQSMGRAHKKAQKPQPNPRNIKSMKNPRLVQNVEMRKRPQQRGSQSQVKHIGRMRRWEIISICRTASKERGEKGRNGEKGDMARATPMKDCCGEIAPDAKCLFIPVPNRRRVYPHYPVKPSNTNRWNHHPTWRDIIYLYFITQETLPPEWGEYSDRGNDWNQPKWKRAEWSQWGSWQLKRLLQTAWGNRSLKFLFSVARYLPGGLF